ncbi:MAG: trigger factor [Alphaproteobacteria bacterium]|nr:trigger factor [Alphaproteobacteria bacterium]
MQITETASEGLSRTFKVVVDAKDIDEKMGLRLSELAQQVRLPGFRPGHVPASLVKQRFGKELMAEILQDMVRSSSEQALAEKGIRPAAQPQIEIETFDEGKDLEYSLAVETMPDIEPMDFATLKLVRLVPEVPEERVMETIQSMAAGSRQTKALDAPRPSQSGDTVVIDFQGTVDGEAKEGMAATDHRIELGSGAFIAGFEDQLIGLNAGDHAQVKVTFPTEYVNDELAGREAVFEVDVKDVLETVHPELDDAFAAGLGMENLDALKQAVRERMTREYGGMARMRLKRDLLDQLADAHAFPIPQGMADAEFEAIWSQFEEARQRSPEDVADELNDKSEDELKDEYRNIAERRVRLGLLLSEVGRLNNIEVSQDDVNRAIMDEARRHPGHEQEVFKQLSESPEAQASVRAPIFEEKVVDFIVEMANVEEREVSLDELMREPEEETEAKKKPAAKSKKAKSKSSSSRAKSSGSEDATEESGGAKARASKQD